jgi:hypothetical protein
MLRPDVETRFLDSLEEIGLHGDHSVVINEPDVHTQKSIFLPASEGNFVKKGLNLVDYHEHDVRLYRGIST